MDKHPSRDLMFRILTRDSLVERLKKEGRRTRFCTMGGNEIAPAGMHSGCPAYWTIKDVLVIPQWVELSEVYEKGYRILERHEVPTAIVLNMTKYTVLSGGCVYLGEGDEWLQCVVDYNAGPSLADRSTPDAEASLDLDGVRTPPTPR